MALMNSIPYGNATVDGVNGQKPLPLRGALFFQNEGQMDHCFIANGTDWIKIPLMAAILVELQVMNVMLFQNSVSGLSAADDPSILRADILNI